jgi:hypothetical protein
MLNEEVGVGDTGTRLNCGNPALMRIADAHGRRERQKGKGDVETLFTKSLVHHFDTNGGNC